MIVLILLENINTSITTVLVLLNKIGKYGTYLVASKVFLCVSVLKCTQYVDKQALNIVKKTNALIYSKDGHSDQNIQLFIF